MPRRSRVGHLAAAASTLRLHERRAGLSLTSPCARAASRPRPMARPRARGAADPGGPTPVDELSRPADAPPMIVPQGRDKPRAIRREYQIRQDALPMGIVAPTAGLLGAGLDQHVLPAGVQRHLVNVREDDVHCAGVEMSKPPRLLCGVLAQDCQHARVLIALLLEVVAAARPSPLVRGARQLDRGLGLKDQRNCGRDRQAAGSGLLDPCDVSVTADPPLGTAWRTREPRNCARRPGEGAVCSSLEMMLPHSNERTLADRPRRWRMNPWR